jgi:uncharacterized membrane protein
LLRRYAKAVAAAVTGAVDVALVALLDGAANADTWLTGAAVAVASFLGTVVVAKVENARDVVADFGDSVADEGLV